MLKKPPEYLKVAELARQLGVDKRTIWRWASADKRLVEVRRLGPRLGVRVRMRRDVTERH